MCVLHFLSTQVIPNFRQILSSAVGPEKFARTFAIFIFLFSAKQIKILRRSREQGIYLQRYGVFLCAAENT